MSMKAITTLGAHTDRVWHAAWDRNGKYLATCGGDKTIKIWTKAKGNEGKCIFPLFFPLLFFFSCFPL